MLLKKLNKIFILLIFTLCLARNSFGIKNIKLEPSNLDRITVPVIGIVTLPTSKKLKDTMGQNYEAYVPSSYKKWVEQTGARAVVIPHFLPKGQLRELINQIDGILFPGGAPALIMNDKPTPFMKKWEFIYDLAYEQNVKGNTFPIWGTCLGFEAIVYRNSQYRIQTTEVNQINVNKKLKWIKKNYKGSYFEEQFRNSIAFALTKKRLSYFAHHWGFTVKDFESVPSLRQNFKVIGYYKHNKKKIVSAIQHNKYPIVGVQFHPEKILFEHKTKVNIQLSKDSMRASQELSRILFDHAISNTNHFKNKRIMERIAFKNFNNQKSVTVFETIYAFKPAYFRRQNLKKPAYIKKVN